MTPSLENRQRIALLAFFAGDHLLWYYGGHFEQVSLFYVIVSEMVRIGALVAFVMSFSCITAARSYLLCIVYYCYAMLPLNIYGGVSEHSRFQTPVLNLLWFKNNSTVPISYGVLAAGLYILALICLYFYVFKPAGHPLLKKQ